MKVLIKYSEIGLKGKNQSDFINKLIGNIQKSANRTGLDIQNVLKQRSRIICNFNTNDKQLIEKTLKNVFGIYYFSYVFEVEKNMDSIIQKTNEMLDEFKGEYKKISFKAKRSDKKFPLQSPEINSQLAVIAKKKGFWVDFDDSQITIYIEVTDTTVYMYSKRIMCYSGLPVGTSGKVLVLLSGGFDSPVAAIQLLKRGCTVDFLHFHTYVKNEFVLDSKIKQLAEKVNNFAFKSKLHLIPYSFFDFMTQGKIPPRYELIFFKHYILKVAEKLAIENGYDAIVTGDSLAQVASQTIENLRAAGHGVQMPIFRPLLTYDKEEIINLAKKYDTYELSIEEYKDCCSLASKNPMTQTKIDKFQEILDTYDLNNLIEKSIEEMNSYWIKN